VMYYRYNDSCVSDKWKEDEMSKVARE